MTQPTGLCPNCATLSTWQVENISWNLPPTGGDYDWIETDATMCCTNCQANFQARVRVDIDSSQIERLISSPMPTITGEWQYSVVAYINKRAEDFFSVEVVAMFCSHAEAEQALVELGGGFDVTYRRLGILRLTPDGYQELDGTALDDSANRLLTYALQT